MKVTEKNKNTNKKYSGRVFNQLGRIKIQKKKVTAVMTMKVTFLLSLDGIWKVLMISPYFIFQNYYNIQL